MSQQTILLAEQALTQAEREGDAPTLQALLSNEFQGITFSGERVDKATFIARLCHPGFHFHSLDIEDLVVLETGSAFIVLGRSRFEATAGGQAFKASARFLDVWCLDEAQWKLSASSVTPERS